jgi:hypothetical protein
MLCQRLKSCTPNITRKEDGFATSIVFISHVVCLGLSCFVFCRCLLVIYLFISRVVGFALSCYLLLSSCFLLVHFPHCCLDFRIFCFFNKFFCNNTFVS